MPPVPFPEIDGWVSLELVVLYQGEVTETTINFKADPPVQSEQELTNLANIVEPAIIPLLQSCMSVEGTLVLTRYTTRNKNFPNARVERTQSAVGGGTGDGSPGSVTLAVSSKTGRLGRRYRGRNFMPAIAEQFTDGNLVVSGYMTVVANLFGRLLQGFATPTTVYKTAVASRTFGLLTTIISYGIEQYIDSQRRRLHARGR
jgi:hypothetical protein